ncbi:MAG TPA: response regulator [Polyangia bacterium]|nr:response regulator [Polyangia bacterium]
MRGSVLIVHDDLGVGRCLGGFLETNDYKVLYASTGPEALAVLEEDVPRLLVIGVGLPLLGGWKLIEALAHYPDLSRIPRLLVSPGDAPAPLAARALALLEARDGDAKPDPTPAPDEAPDEMIRRVASA